MNKQMKIFCGIAAIGIVVGTVVALNDNTQSSTITIGANLTLTGGVSYWALELKKGMDVAERIINENPDGYKVHVVYADNRFDSKSAISAYKKLDLVDKAEVIISCFTPMCQAIAGLSEASGKPLLMTITSATDIAKKSSLNFRDYVTQQQQCPPLAEYVFKDLGLRRGVFLVLEDDYGKDGVLEFSKAFASLGGNIEMGAYFSRSDMSVREHVAKILGDHPQFVFLIAGDQSLLTACRQIREFDKNVQIIGLTAFDSDDVWNALGVIGDGIVFSSGCFDDKGAMGEIFSNTFVACYGRKPGITNVYGFTILKYLYEAGVKSRNMQKPWSAIIAEMSVDSVRGHLTVNPSHDIISATGIFQRIGGKSVLRRVFK